MCHRIRVLIVSSQARARQSLRALLSTIPRIQDVREAVDGEEAVRLIPAAQTNVVLVDLWRTELDGLQAMQLIKSIAPQVKVIVLSLYSEHRQPALAAGADQFLVKQSPSDELLDAILGSGQGDL